MIKSMEFVETEGNATLISTKSFLKLSVVATRKNGGAWF